MRAHILVGSVVSANILLSVVGVLFSLSTLAGISYVLTLVTLCLLLLSKSFTKSEIHLLIGIFLFFIVPVLVHYMSYKDYSIVYIFHYLASALSGVIVGRYFTKIPFKAILITIAIIEILFIFSFTDEGNSQTVNRTYFSVPIVIVYLCLCISNYFKNKKFDISALIIVIVISVISYSRSTALLSFLVLGVFIIMASIREKYRPYQIFGLICFYIGLLAAIPFVIDIMINHPFTQRYSERGFDTGRFVIWSYYLTQLDFRSVMLGVNVNELWISLDEMFFHDNGRHTLHNSFLQLHSHGGIVPVIAVSAYLFRSLLNKFTGRHGILVLCVFSLFLGKASFDVSIFPQRFDFLVFGIGFFLLKRKAT